MLSFEMAIRGSAIGLLALIAVAVPRGAPRAPAAWIAAAYALTIVAYCIVSSPGLAHSANLWLAPLGMLGHCAPIAFWLMARAFFEDGFRPDRTHVAMVGLWCAVALVYWFAIWPLGGTLALLVDVAIHVVAAGLVVLSLVAAVRGARADLVEPRRRLRPIFVAMSGIYMLVILGAEIAIRGMPPPAWLSTLNAAGILVASFAFALMVLGVGNIELFVQAPRPATPEAVTEPPAAITADPVVLAKIRHAMDRDRVYREEGLTIAVFSVRLGVSEHRVRQAINAGLGHRNFNAFLNAYRIAEAKAALADPTQVEVPILTIAMDAGFGSIGPFNRAFKAETGLTPSEFRARSVSV